MISENTMSKYLHILDVVKHRINENGKDFTHTQFAELFNVSRKTFEGFYNAKIIRFDLLFEIAYMYELNIEII